MGLMTFLRNKAGIIIVAVIGIALVAFLLGEVFRSGAPLWASRQNEVGRIDGEPISYAEFNGQVEMATNNMRQQMGGQLNPQMASYAVEQAWQQNLQRVLYNQEIERVGLNVGKNELNDMVSGKNPDPMIVQNFANPQTGELDRAQLTQFLANVSNEPANSALSDQWGNFLLMLKENRLIQKYNGLVQNCLYVTSLEAGEDYSQRNKIANFSYVLLDYASIPDKDIKLSDGDFKEYFNEHKKAFYNNSELRSFDFVVLNAAPTAQDTAATLEIVTKLGEELAQSTNDSLFASSNSQTKYPFNYIKKGTLNPALDSLVFSAPKGTIVGPVYSNGLYEVAKVVDVRNSPDSVTARHILLNAAAEGGTDKAKAKADSIANLVRGGANFAALAVEFSTDGSKNNGGELGTFPRGRMVPEFENAVFDAKPGDVLVVTSQFGVHVIKVDAQSGMSKVVKAAIVDKAVQSSKATTDAAYKKASNFFGSISSKTFGEEAKKNGLEVLHATNISPMQAYIPGLESSPRELIRWAYKADKGDLSDKIYELDNQYVVAILTDIKPKGQLTWQQVRNEIQPDVLKFVKAKQLKQKAEDALKGSQNINQVAQKLKSDAVPVNNIVMANPVIPGLAQENAVVGTVFGLQPKKLSKAVEGNQGVYVVELTSFENPAAPGNLDRQKAQAAQGLAQRASNLVFRALMEKTEIEDNRVKFY
ncbi:peptidylprolyl isomerase [Olivibacter sitiensis]|uniref:peptidylprolyl isomerase n=1 Tax=Olivibacter sitiensis TaxID=376470 RepID=UPI000485B4F3|nr:SurA N-terminal domain-containing protein [Olivibacter sitiensis]